jgi:hypothetical protein
MVCVTAGSLMPDVLPLSGERCSIILNHLSGVPLVRCSGLLGMAWLRSGTLLTQLGGSDPRRTQAASGGTVAGAQHRERDPRATWSMLPDYC